MGRDRVIAGNWKMYKTIEEAVAFVNALPTELDGLGSRIYLAVPFTAIAPMAEAVGERPLVVGAQNMNDAGEGAFTGEIAGRMLVDAGAKFVLLGHSERRHVFGESDDFINRKVKRALEDGLQPVLCVGETLEQREAGQTESVLRSQIQGSLAGIEAAQMKNLIVAYEPVWAIGTGKTATPEMAQESHSQLRGILRDQFSDDVADSCVIQYGGSVKPENAEALLAQPDIDGVLVGGASLEADSFAGIVRAAVANV